MLEYASRSLLELDPTISVWKPAFERVYALVDMLADILSQHTLLFHLGETFRPKAKASVHEGR